MSLKFSITGRFLFVMTLLISLFSDLTAKDINGYVTDKNSGETLPYANVTVKGMDRGTTTNQDGYFVLVDLPDTVITLEVFYIGYVTHEVSVADSGPLEIKMEQSLLQGETISVTAEKYEIWQSAEEVAQVTFSPKFINRLPSLGEADIFRSLQLLPGISAVSDASAGLYIRGGTPDQNLVMLDGMTVYHVDHFFGFFSAFNADAIKDVQVYKGGFPAKYGGRLSSVIDLTGKTGDINETQFGLGVNLLSANAMLEIPVFDKGSFLISARRSYSDILESGLYNSLYDFISNEDNSSQPQGPGIGGGPGGGRGGIMQEETRPKFYYYDLNAKLSLVPGTNDLLAFSFYSGKDNLDDSQEMGGLRLKGGGDEDVFGTRVSQEITNWGNLAGSVKWAHQWNERLNSNLLVAASNYFSNYNRDMSFNTEGGSGVSDSLVFRGRGGFASEEQNDILDYSLRFDNEYHVSSNHRLGIGMWASKTETDYRATLNDTISLLDRKNQSLQLSFYGQDKWQLTRNWGLTFGLRSTYYDPTKSYYWEPRISTQYEFWGNLKLKAAWGQYYQFIHRITNEDILEGSRDFWLVADQNLEPGYAEHYIAGVSYETSGYLFDIEAYHKDLDNLVEFTRRFHGRADYQDLFFFGSGIAQGVEFLIQKKMGDLNGWASYTLSKVDNTFPGFNDGEPFPASYDRKHELKLIGTYRLGNWNFSSTWIYATGMAYTAPESQYYLDLLDGDSQSYIHVGEKNTNRLPDYQRLDVSVAYLFGGPNQYGEKEEGIPEGEFGLSIFNVLNHKNVWYRKYDLDVTPIVVTDVNMLGFTPTLYFKIKF